MKVKFKLLHACIEENVNEVVQLLNDNSDIDVLYDDGTYFKYAIRTNNVKILKALLDYYALYEDRKDDEQLCNIFIVTSDGRELSTEMKEIIDEVIGKNDNSTSEFSDISELDGHDIWTREEITEVEPVCQSTLTEKNLKFLDYKYYLNHLKHINYKYWLLNLQAEICHDKGDYEHSIKAIRDAANLVTSNVNMVFNSEYKAIVMYNYLRFVGDDHFFDGIKYKGRLVDYLPTIHLFAEQCGDDLIRYKAFELMKQYFGKEIDERIADVDNGDILMNKVSEKDLSQKAISCEFLERKEHGPADPVTSDEESTTSAYARESLFSAHIMDDLTKHLELTSLGANCFADHGEG